MKCLHIQLLPELCVGEAEIHVGELTAMAISRVTDAVVNVQRGYDDGPYINVNIDTSDIKLLWSSILTKISSDPCLADATIVCCEGDHGWDDYLLLHHYDENENLDRLQ